MYGPKKRVQVNPSGMRIRTRSKLARIGDSKARVESREGDSDRARVTERERERARGREGGG